MDFIKAVLIVTELMMEIIGVNSFKQNAFFIGQIVCQPLLPKIVSYDEMGNTVLL